MTDVQIPDPQLCYRDALDNAFYVYIDDRFGPDNYSHEEYTYLCERWSECKPSEPLVFSAEQMEEDYGPDVEFGWEVANQAMEKDIQSEIDQKIKILRELQVEH